MLELITSRFRLCPISDKNLDDLVLLWSDAEVTRYLPGDEPVPRQVVKDELVYMTAHWQQHGFGSWLHRLLPAAVSACRTHGHI